MQTNLLNVLLTGKFGMQHIVPEGVWWDDSIGHAVGGGG